MNLYKINEEYKAVLANLESMDDISQDVIDDTMSVFKEDLENKCLAVAAFIKNLDAEASAIKCAEESMSSRRKAIENKSKRMREYLAANLPHRLKDAQTTISPLKGRERYVVDDESLLPESCFKIERKVISSAVKLEFIGLPDGAAHIETGKPSVTIR